MDGATRPPHLIRHVQFYDMAAAVDDMAMRKRVEQRTAEPLIRVWSRWVLLGHGRMLGRFLLGPNPDTPTIGPNRVRTAPYRRDSDSSRHVMVTRVASTARTLVSHPFRFRINPPDNGLPAIPTA